MKLHKGWIITTSHGDEIIVMINDVSTLNWAKRHNYEIKRTFILK